MDQLHKEVLRKFEALKGHLLIGKKFIKGVNSENRLPADKYVSGPHILHDLIRGFYKPARKPYLLSYQATESEENYGKQIEWDEAGTNFLRIEMNPPNGAKDNRKKSDIEAARYNMENKIPIGILHKIKKGQNRVLGLGLIVSERKDGVFIVQPHSLPPEENINIKPLEIKIAFQPNADSIENGNFEKTVKKCVSQSIIKQYLPSPKMKEIKRIYDTQDIAVWGVEDGKNEVIKKKYDKLSAGDIIFFYKEQNLYCKAVVTYKVENARLANALWNEEKLKNIYFLTDVEPCSVPIEIINEAIYSEKNQSAIREFEVLDSNQSEVLLNKLELDIEDHLKGITKEDYHKIVELKIDKPLDTMAKRASRVEQAYLRGLLFDKKLYEKCACCGNLYAVSHLFAAHIKKRSHCNTEEKLDSQIVMPMCKFGCDTLYEDGYLSVDINGYFIRLDKVSKKIITPHVEGILEKLNGRKCSYWNDNTVKYFAWHYNYHSNI